MYSPDDEVPDPRIGLSLMGAALTWLGPALFWLLLWVFQGLERSGTSAQLRPHSAGLMLVAVGTALMSVACPVAILLALARRDRARTWAAVAIIPLAVGLVLALISYSIYADPPPCCA
jgi:hypothetical protein